MRALFPSFSNEGVWIDGLEEAKMLWVFSLILCPGERVWAEAPGLTDWLIALPWFVVASGQIPPHCSSLCQTGAIIPMAWWFRAYIRIHLHPSTALPAGLWVWSGKSYHSVCLFHTLPISDTHSEIHTNCPSFSLCLFLHALSLAAGNKASSLLCYAGHRRRAMWRLGCKSATWIKLNWIVQLFPKIPSSLPLLIQSSLPTKNDKK